MLVDKKQKRNIQKVYKIMDNSGDGRLEKDELKIGFEKIFANLEDDEVSEIFGDGVNKEALFDDGAIEEIIQNVDIDGNNHVDYNDFLLASIDLSKESFIEYLKEAYKLLFSN